MLAAIIITVVLITGLVFYAMRSKTRLKVTASLLKLASFSIEVESDDRRGEVPPSDRPQVR
jgi:hypothetical protein